MGKEQHGLRWRTCFSCLPLFITGPGHFLNKEAEHCQAREMGTCLVIPLPQKEENKIPGSQMDLYTDLQVQARECEIPSSSHLFSILFALFYVSSCSPPISPNQITNLGKRGSSAEGKARWTMAFWGNWQRRPQAFCKRDVYSARC